jgi:hypothetical protein
MFIEVFKLSNLLSTASFHQKNHWLGQNVTLSTIAKTQMNNKMRKLSLVEANLIVISNQNPKTSKAGGGGGGGG